MQYKFNAKAIVLAKLTSEELVDLANFDCGDETMSTFLKEEALAEQDLGMNVTMLLYYEGQLAGFYSICTDSIKLAKEEQTNELYLSNIPAIKIARLGRDIKFQSLGLGKFLINHVIHRAIEIDSDICGVRMITLDAYADKVPYYEALGFKHNQHRMYNGARRETVSMRYDIYSQIF